MVDTQTRTHKGAHSVMKSTEMEKRAGVSAYGFVSRLFKIGG